MCVLNSTWGKENSGIHVYTCSHVYTSNLDGSKEIKFEPTKEDLGGKDGAGW